MLSLRFEKTYHSFLMKKSILIILTAVLFSTCGLLKAQDIGIENPVTEKNIMIGIKGGISAMDMVYNTPTKNFVNHTVLYQQPSKIANCFAGGITVERCTPRFSYGVELMLTGLDARKPADSIRYAERDSAFYAHIRIPVRFNLTRKNRAIPYIFVAPEVSSYLYLPISEKLSFNGYSVWNGVGMDWGSKNANMLNVNVVAGAGVDYRIGIGNYEIRARFEAGYKLGLLNTLPQALPMTRKIRGWEATLGLVFPLFKNSHYSWLM